MSTRPSPTFSPLYRQIKALILQALGGGRMASASHSSEQELAARFQREQGTVRKAIDEMAAENLLVRKGKGTSPTNDPARSSVSSASYPGGDGAPRPPQSVPLDAGGDQGHAGGAHARAVGEPSSSCSPSAAFSGRPGGRSTKSISVATVPGTGRLDVLQGVAARSTAFRKSISACA